MNRKTFDLLEEITTSYENGNRIQLFEYIESNKPQQLAELFHYIFEECNNEKLAHEVMTFIYHLYK